MHLPPWDFLLIILVLAIVVPWRGVIRVRELLTRPYLSTKERLTLYGSTIVFQWLAAIVTVWRSLARGLTPEALGMAPESGARGLILGLLMALALGSLQIFSLRQLSRLPIEKRGHLFQVALKLMPQNFSEAFAFVILVVTVSLCEEVIYRGFAFAVFKNVGAGSLMFALIGSAALFAIGHAYQGKRGLISTFVLGMILALARSWADSLLPAIMTHLIVDLTAGLAGKSGKRATAAREALK
jgi:membrane protease YdiL (CAAX protease family)